MRDLKSRFESKVDRSGGPGACHPWLDAPGREGYGSIFVAGKARLAHHVAWELATGQPVPRAHHVDHECHNEAMRNGQCHHGVCRHHLCCNERHLVLRTPQAHMAASYPWQRVQGSAHGRAKLTEGQVREIKVSLTGGESSASLARRFAVSSGTISNIKRGRNWTHVTEPERGFN